jgi:putative heme iron utilization protein
MADVEIKAAGHEARALLLGTWQGILSTQSRNMPGYPFGSVAAYCLDASGAPLFLISGIAMHTSNLRADARCSYIVVAPGDDIQASARLTLVGECEPVAEAAIDTEVERYYRYFPDMRDFHRTLDFRLFRLQPRRRRYTGAFGRAHWLAPESVLPANPFDAEQEVDIVAHMNKDHANALFHYCHQHGLTPPEGVTPVMTGIGAEGLHLRVGSRIVYIPFPTPVTTPLDARETLAIMALAKR